MFGSVLFADSMGACLPAFLKQSFSVNTDDMLERLPAIEFETMSEWPKIRDWGDQEDRPLAGYCVLELVCFLRLKNTLILRDLILR